MICRRWMRRACVSRDQAQGRAVAQLEAWHLEIGRAQRLLLVGVLADRAPGVVPFGEATGVVEAALPLALGRVARRGGDRVQEHAAAGRADERVDEECRALARDRAQAPGVRRLRAQVG